VEGIKLSLALLKQVLAFHHQHHHRHHHHNHYQQQQLKNRLLLTCSISKNTLPSTSQSSNISLSIRLVIFNFLGQS
jgi:hypothetical protein